MTGTDTVAGAGIPGLSACRLTAPGLDVIILEARERAAGPAVLQGTSDGGALDPGATWLWIPTSRYGGSSPSSASPPTSTLRMSVSITMLNIPCAPN